MSHRKAKLLHTEQNYGGVDWCRKLKYKILINPLTFAKKLVATINKLVSTEAYKRLVIETRYKSLHVIIVESSSPNDIANIQRLYGRFSV